MFYQKFALAKHLSMLIACFSFLFTGLGGLPPHILHIQPPRGGPDNVGPHIPTSNQLGWNLIFDDELNGPTLDTNKWNIEDTASSGYHACCLGYGVQYFTPNALSFTNGSLQITTNKHTMGNYAYTSGAITTENKFSFLYGRVDIRAKLPKTQGFWPALWLLPNNSVGIAPFEIDMMELLGNNPHNIYMTNHWGRQYTQGIYTGSDFSQAFHVFSIIWSAQTISWYIDGTLRFQTSQGVSNKSMYLIINSSLGGRWPGYPDASTVLPQNMNIDYVRVYQPLINMPFLHKHA